MTDELLIGIEARAFNATIRNRRKELGLTQRQLAQKANVSVTAVNHLEGLRRARLTDAGRRVLRILGLNDDASPAWLDEMNLYGKRTIERSVTADLLANPHQAGIPMFSETTQRLAQNPEQTLIDDTFADPVDRRRLQAALEALPERQRRVVEMRYGFEDRRPKDYEEIGYELGLTRERARQIETQALARLADLMQAGK